MSIAFRKVWRDLWNNKWRTLLVVASIAVGVTALGMTTSSNILLNSQMAAARVANQSPHARLSLTALIDDDAVQAVAQLPQVAEAEGWINAAIRWKPSPDADWQDSFITAKADYNYQQFDLFPLLSGQYPEGDEIAVEHGHADFYNVPPIGEVLFVEVNDNAVPLVVSGTLRDSAHSPPPYSPFNKPSFYISRHTAERVLGFRNFNNLAFTVHHYSPDAVAEAADAVEKKLKRLGTTLSVEAISTAAFQDPDHAIQQEFINGLTAVLIIMGYLSMGLSLALVSNTINAIVSQQVTQIGIMKTIGGEYRPIVTLYMAGVLVYGGLSLLIAVPLGLGIGHALASFWLYAFNVPPPPFALLPQPLLMQVGVGLIAPLAAALAPVSRGVAISVREALAAYGLGSGRYGAGKLDRAISSVRGLPRMVALSMRNTFRRVERAALTQLTLVAAGTIFMLVSATGDSFFRTFDYVWQVWGYDVVIVLDDFHRSAKIEALAESIAEVEHVEVWTWMQAKAYVPGASGLSNTYEAQLRGVPDGSVMINPALLHGRRLSSDDGHAVLLNQQLASDMAVGVGDEVIIDLGAGRKTRWTVVGIVFDVGASGLQNTVFMRHTVLNADLHQAGHGTVVQVLTRDDTFQTQDRVKRILQDYFSSHGVGVSLAMGQIENKQMGNVVWGVIGGLLQMMTLTVAIVGSIGLSGTLSINVYERRREIGVMRAVGASSSDVALIFIGEGLMLAIISWIVAVPLSVIGGQLFVDVLAEALSFPLFYRYSIGGALLWLGIVIVLAILASWLPARRATQISVRESLAYE